MSLPAAGEGQSRPEEGSPAANLGGSGGGEERDPFGVGDGGDRMRNYPSTPDLTPQENALSGHHFYGLTC